MAASLPQLPTEIISEIASYLIQGRAQSYGCNMLALYGLRLTCRTLYLKTLHDFGQALSTIIVDFSLESLDRLYNISQHPELRGCVQSIYFARDGHHPIRLPLLDEDPGCSLEHQIEKALREGLRIILLGLPNLKGTFIVTPFAASFHQGWRNKYTTEYRNTISKIEDTPTAKIETNRYVMNANQLFSILMQALEDPHLSIQHLEFLLVGNASRYSSWRDDAFGTCYHSLSNYRCGLRHVRQLHLTLYSCENSSSCVHCLAEDTIVRSNRDLAVLQVLQDLPHLTALGLGSGVSTPRLSGERMLLVHTLHLLNLPCLKRLELFRAFAEEGALRSFYARHEESLREVIVDDLCITDGTWASFLGYLLEGHTRKLVKLHLRWEYNKGPSSGRGSQWLMFEKPHIELGLGQTLSLPIYD